METIAYLDCFSGISGDMFLGALLHAGVPEAFFPKLIEKLHLHDTTIVSRGIRNTGIAATGVCIESASQPLRTLGDIQKVIRQSTLSEAVKKKSLEVFLVLAEAESKVHDCDIAAVHFHEVGAVDTLVDIVGVVSGLDYLNIAELVCSPLPLGRGWVKCAHGSIPLPAPAVTEILKDVPVSPSDISMELVTPTGAALVKVLASSYGQIPKMHIEQVGYGAGSGLREDNKPNLLRLMIGKKVTLAEQQRVEVIETNIDDMSPERCSHVAEMLLQQGALDVFWQPCYMKKGRLGMVLQVIVDPVFSLQVKETVLSETTAIGLRYRQEARMTLARQLINIATPWGKVRVKKITRPDGDEFHPEYEDCHRLAMAEKISWRKIYGATVAMVKEGEK